MKGSYRAGRKPKSTPELSVAVSDHPTRSRQQPALSPLEWDFRSVHEKELLTAVLYEYTRSSPRIRKCIEEWHARPVDFVMLRECEETAALRDEVRRLKTPTNAQAAAIARKASDCNAPLKGGNLFRIQLYIASLSKPDVYNFRFVPLYSDFTKSWTQMRITYEGNFSENCVFPALLDREAVRIVSQIEDHAAAPRKLPTERVVHMTIDLGRPVDEIVESFLRWLKDGRVGVSKSRQRLRGKKPRWEFLKWLAAYRLDGRGFSHGEALRYMEEHLPKIARPVPEVIPSYSSRSAWYTAVKKCRDILETDCTRVISEAFELFP